MADTHLGPRPVRPGTKSQAEVWRAWAEEARKGCQADEGAARRLGGRGHSRSVRAAAEQWIATRVDLGEGTRNRYASIITKHGDRPLRMKSANRVTHETVQSYISDPHRGGRIPRHFRLELIVIRCTRARCRSTPQDDSCEWTSTASSRERGQARHLGRRRPGRVRRP